MRTPTQLIQECGYFPTHEDYETTKRLVRLAMREALLGLIVTDDVREEIIKRQKDLLND